VYVYIALLRVYSFLVMICLCISDVSIFCRRAAFGSQCMSILLFWVYIRCLLQFFGIFQVYPSFVDALDVRFSVYLHCFFECICSFFMFFFFGNSLYPFFVDALDVRVSVFLYCSFECIFIVMIFFVFFRCIPFWSTRWMCDSVYIYSAFLSVFVQVLCFLFLGTGVSLFVDALDVRVMSILLF